MHKSLSKSSSESLVTMAVMAGRGGGAVPGDSELHRHRRRLQFPPGDQPALFRRTIDRAADCRPAVREPAGRAGRPSAVVQGLPGDRALQRGRRRSMGDGLARRLGLRGRRARAGPQCQRPQHHRGRQRQGRISRAMRNLASCWCPARNRGRQRRDCALHRRR